MSVILPNILWSSEVNLLLPILIDFIDMMNSKFENFTYVFHSTVENKNLINEGDKVVLAAVGAGFIFGSSLWKF